MDRDRNVGGERVSNFVHIRIEYHSLNISLKPLTDHCEISERLFIFYKIILRMFRFSFIFSTLNKSICS